MSCCRVSMMRVSLLMSWVLSSHYIIINVLSIQAITAPYYSLMQQQDPPRRPNSQEEPEDTVLLATDQEGYTTIVSKSIPSESSLSYVLASNLKYEEGQNSKVFTDHSFPLLPEDIEAVELDRKPVVKRLIHLYPRRHRPQFFNIANKKDSQSPSSKLPHFLTQLSMIQFSTLRRLFITQQFSEKGKYEVLVNRNGRLEKEVVDDYIPLHTHNQQSFWGMILAEPWKLILTKVWAKVKGGYWYITKSQPFEFLQTFTVLNWKYYNLSVDGRQFLAHHFDKLTPDVKILLKAKRCPEVKKAGLIEGRYCYQMTKLSTYGKEDEKGQGAYLVVTINSLYEHHWTGSLSLFDKGFVERVPHYRENYNLSHTLTMNQKDFLNLFSSAQATIEDIPKPNFTSNYSFTVPANTKEPLFFNIQFQREGFLIYSILQPLNNRAGPVIHNKITLSDANRERPNVESERYMGVQYIMSRQIGLGGEQVGRSRLSDQIMTEQNKFNERYNPIAYDAYDLDLMKGYGRGDGHFIAIISGNYTLRIKTQTVSVDTEYTIQFTCHEPTDFHPVSMDHEGSRKFINHTLVSMIESQPNKRHLGSQKNETYCWGEEFSRLGFGFFAIKLSKSSPYPLSIDVNPNKLRDEGYKLKNEYSDRVEPFSQLLMQGQSMAIILKQTTKQSKWPPTGIAIVKK